MSENQSAGAIAEMMRVMGVQARAASKEVARATAERKHAALIGAAEALLSRKAEIFEANAADLAAGRDKGLTSAMLDRLALDDDRLIGIANGLRAIAEQADPVGVTRTGDPRSGFLRSRSPADGSRRC